MRALFSAPTFFFCSLAGRSIHNSYLIFYNANDDNKQSGSKRDGGGGEGGRKGDREKYCDLVQELLVNQNTKQLHLTADIVVFSPSLIQSFPVNVKSRD